MEFLVWQAVEHLNILGANLHFLQVGTTEQQARWSQHVQEQ
jgi:hypothetical protein